MTRVRERSAGSIALCVLLLASSARADVEIKSARVKQGLAAFATLDYLHAIVLLERAREDQLEPSDAVAALEALATCHVAVDDPRAAREDLRELLRRAPDYHYDRTVSPRLRSLLEEVRAAVASAPPSAPPVVSPPIVLVAAPPAPPPPRPLYHRTWFWSAVGGALTAGALVAVGIAVARPTDSASVSVIIR